MTSSNWVRNFWTTTYNSAMSNMTNASNFIGRRINNDSNIISNRIQNLTLDAIYPGVNYQYIVNNVFNSNLNIPHHLIVGSLRVQDIDLSMNNDSVLPNQQLKFYINELTSNTIFQADVFQSAFDTILSGLEVNWSNYTATKQDNVSSSLKSITKTNLSANIALVTDAQGKITNYIDSNQNVLSKYTIQYLNNDAPLQSYFNDFNTNTSNIYTCNVINAVRSYATNLSNYLVSTPNCNVSTDGRVNTKILINNTYTSNIVYIEPITYLRFADQVNTNKLIPFETKKFIDYPLLASTSNNILYWYRFDNNTYNYQNDAASNLTLISGKIGRAHV